LSAKPYREQPIVTRDTVIVATKDNRINFIDSLSGQIYRIEEIGANLTSPMSLVVGPSGCVYIGTEDGIRSISFPTTGEYVNWISYGRDFRHTGYVDCLREKEYYIFDTGTPSNPYPSISGTHNGTIIPSHDINVNKLYTYPCPGTGGHTEYARIWNKTWNATATGTDMPATGITSLLTTPLSYWQTKPTTTPSAQARIRKSFTIKHIQP